MLRLSGFSESDISCITRAIAAIKQFIDEDFETLKSRVKDLKSQIASEVCVMNNLLVLIF